MRKATALFLAVLLASVMSNAAFARNRIERWADVSGSYFNEGDNVKWTLTGLGRLNLIRGVKSIINTGVDLTVGENGAAVAAEQQFRLFGRYGYNLSRTTTLNVDSTMRTLTPDSSTKGYTEDITVQTNLYAWKYLSRRLSWSLGMENWIRTSGNINRIFTEGSYVRPFGRYLSKANLIQRLYFTKDIGGNDDEIKTTTVFTYDFYKRVSLTLTGIFAFQRKIDWAVGWTQKSANIVYHFF